jgi:hypothetical protein
LPVANGNIFAVDSTRLSLRVVANEAVRAMRCGAGLEKLGLMREV